MAKDPAFLFYPGDYLRDTQMLSEKAQVAYDRIMCEHMRNICISQQQLNFLTKRLNEEEKNELMTILKKTDEGYQIEWVAISISKRRDYSKSRSENRRGKSKKDMKNISLTYEHHMENENENENINEIKKGGTGGNKEPDFSFWHTMPLPKDVGNLPELKIKSAIELVKITKGIDVTWEDVVRLWGVFKINNLTGKKYYASEVEVEKHFTNWIKNQKFENNGKSKQVRPRDEGIGQFIQQARREFDDWNNEQAKSNQALPKSSTPLDEFD